MRIRSVTAHAFGPFCGETLEFAEGMTVVVGDNESGKSSWHAAIFAALCGPRRGLGRPSLDDQRFAELHKPWDHDEWRVSARISLDNGRKIELRQDLAGKVDCQARDGDTGEDVSSEIITHDGSPDGSRWLGLNRSTFVATACINQAQLLRVHDKDKADGLQEHLQQAATSAGTDMTAAAALERLKAFQSERVGTDRSNSTKPLRQAKQAYDNAARKLQRTEREHEDYLEHVQRVEQLRVEARVAADDALAGQVIEALAAWRRMPPQPPAPSRTSQQVRDELSVLPAPPEGDLQEHPNVRHALERTQQRQAQLELHERDRPSDHPPAVPNVAATEDQLRDLARALETSSSELAPTHTLGDPPRRGMATALLVGGALITVIGVLLLLATNSAVGIGGIILGAALLVGGALARRRRQDGAGPGDPMDTARWQAADAACRREQAAARCRELGVAADPVLLRGIPKARVQAENLQRWEQRRTELHREVTAAAEELASALAERGHPSDGLDAPMLLAAAERYRDACQARAELAACKAAEQQAAHNAQERSRAERLVIAAAQACSSPAQTSQEAVAALEKWTRQRTTRLGAHDERAELAATVDQVLLAELNEATAADRLPKLRRKAEVAQNRAATAAGQLSEMAKRIVSVAEAEEEQEDAKAELERVQELQWTLERTITFLDAAQKSAHREIAPILNQTVEKWLPRVTGGRYTDVRVNPKNLDVEVCGPTGRWRRADRLSHGTAEQIYLLLRVALAEHLTRGHDTCPLLLDDVTVHADAARTRDILDLLLRLSTERQIVLFTQEEQVAAWARQHLTGPEHAIVNLSPVAVG